jgi:septal ring factor EnvC (AmiA/AmiB activator)
MVDASFSRQRQLEDRAAGTRQRWIFAVALGVILIGLGYVLLQRGFAGNSAAVVPSATAAAIAAREQVSNELLETTKGLQATQQQAVDQLQVVQDQLVAQKAETKKLSEQIAAVAEKLDALQQSVADIPAPFAHVPTPAAAGKSR